MRRRPRSGTLTLVDPHTEADLTIGPCSIPGCPTGADAEDSWITWVQAAELIGVSTTTINNMVRDGRLEHRPGPRKQPSVSLVSARQVAADRREAQRAAEEAAAERAQARRDRAARRAEAHAAANQPPDDGDVWLSMTETALLLGITKAAVRQKIAADRLPATRHGRRWWIRRQHAENLAAARAARRAR